MAEQDESVTKTGIDALVEYLRQNGETDSSTLARELGVSTGIIEGWVGALEKAGMIKVNYRVGRMFVAPLAVFGADIETLRSSLNIKKESLETDVESQTKLLRNINKKIETLTKSTSAAEDVFKKSAGPLKVELDELDRIEKDAEKHYNNLKLEKAEADRIAQNFYAETKKLEGTIAGFKAFNIGLGESNGMIEDIQSKINRHQGLVKDFEADFENRVGSTRSELAKFREGIDQETSALKEAIEQQQKHLHENERLERYAKREAESIRMTLEKEMTALSNNVAKNKDGIDRCYPLAEAKAKGISAKLDSLRQSFGDLTSMDKQIRDVKSDMDGIKKEYDAAMKQMNEMLDALKVVNAIQDTDVAMKTAAMEDLNKKVSKERDKINNLNDKVDRGKNRINDLGSESKEV